MLFLLYWSAGPVPGILTGYHWGLQQGEVDMSSAKFRSFNTLTGYRLERWGFILTLVCASDRISVSVYTITLLGTTVLGTTIRLGTKVDIGFAPQNLWPPPKDSLRSSRGALPYVGGYQVPVNRPLFYTDLTPNDPFFLFSLHPMTPFFSTFVSNFYIKSANFWRALRAFWEI